MLTNAGLLLHLPSAHRYLSTPTVASTGDIERIQKSAMKVIFGNEYQGYERSLNILNMERLQARRERLSLKFAKKCLKHEKMSDMFPLSVNQSTVRVRNREKFHLNKAFTERYEKSAILSLQRKLNMSFNTEKRQLKALLQVNCVSYVDPITS